MNPVHLLSGKKILVTGATGFIGSHLCRQLLKHDTKVIGISRNRLPQRRENVHWWRGDLVDFDFVKKVMVEEKPDIIFHLGSHVAGSRNLELVLTTFHNNLASTLNLLTAATEIGCRRIILAGSMEEPENKNGCTIPSSPYAAAKWASNGYARMFHALYQTPVSIAKIFMVYGPGQQDLRKLIPYATLSLLRNQPPKLTSGQRQVDWIYVDDVVAGLIAMAISPEIEGCEVDLGSGVLISISALMKQLVKMIDTDAEPLFGSEPDRPMEQERIANIGKTFAKIGWKPTTPLEKGLGLTIDWYRKQSENG